MLRYLIHNIFLSRLPSGSCTITTKTVRYIVLPGGPNVPEGDYGSAKAKPLMDNLRDAVWTVGEEAQRLESWKKR